MINSKGYAAQNAQSPLAPFAFKRRAPQETDVLIEILYCGICHSDIHLARNEWGNANYPMVPGHEIIGKVVQVGSKVRRFKPADLVGVGCLVNSCRHCSSCEQGLEQYCETGFTLTYNSFETGGTALTYGGYSNNIVVDENFVLKISPRLDLAKCAPLLCAGITTYSPLRHWKVGKGTKVAIVGLGGLGHMAVKFAHAFGAQVTVITTSENKRQDALHLGANAVILSKNKNEMIQHKSTFDFMLNTVAAPIDLNPYIELLKRDGTMVLVGVSGKPVQINQGNLIFNRRNFAGSLIGGLKETQAMLDFCAQHNITSEIEIISIQEVNEAFERTIAGKVKYRFVIDMASLK